MENPIIEHNESEEIPFSQIGGHQKEIQDLRFMIELTYQISKKKKQQIGILMHGSPGCGKTEIARAISKLLGDSFFKVIQGPELMSRYVGVAEQQLREAFEECDFESQKRGVPSILFFDECDAVLCNRDSCGSQFEIRFVNQFLSLMDGFEGRGNTVVIAATNRPKALDPAVKRSGRFDKEIYIGSPNLHDRCDIIKIFIKKIKEEFEIDEISEEKILELSEMIEGYNGSDIQGLFGEAKEIMKKRCYTIDKRGRFQKHEELLLKYDDLLKSSHIYIPHHKRV